MNKLSYVLILAAVALLPQSTALAGKFVVHTSAGIKVVHARRLPVIVHRAVPPFAGKHIYQGRLRGFPIATGSDSRSFTHVRCSLLIFQV